MAEAAQAAVPKSVYAKCPECGETLHKVLKGRVSSQGLKAVLKCPGCDRVSEQFFAIKPEVLVPIIVSWMSESKKTTIPIAPGEMVRLGDIMQVDGVDVLVTGIEKQGRRLNRAQAGEIDALWGKRYDRVRLKASLRLSRGRVRPADFLAEPGDVFSVGQEVRIESQPCVVVAIRVKGRGRGATLREGSADAADIVRVYLEPAGKTFEPHRDRGRGGRSRSARSGGWERRPRAR